MKFEIVVIPVSDVDRSEQAGKEPPQSRDHFLFADLRAAVPLLANSPFRR